MLISNKNNNLLLLNFNKIFIKSKNLNLNLNFFFLTSNFFLTHSFNFFSLIQNYTNLLIFNNLNFFYFKIKKNNHNFFKINNKYRSFLFFFKYIFKFKFKYNNFFKYNYLYKKKFNQNFNKSSRLPIFSYFFHFFKNLSKTWNFLTGFSISPFWWDLYSKKNWIRRNLQYTLFKNRYFFNKNSKVSYRKRMRIYDIMSYKNYTKKYILNNFIYFRNFFKNSNQTSLKYILKINPNFRIFKKKNYDWFLSKPYLFLNTYKNYKLNKHYPNYVLFFFYKKYFKFFNVLKRLNFNLKYKKTNNFFFIKNIFNSDYKGKSYRNRYFKSYINLKKKLPFFIFYYSFSESLMKKKFLKRKISLFWFFKLMFNSKITKKNKLMFNYRFFLNKKLNIIKSSRRSKKRNIFIRSFKLVKNLYESKIFSIKVKKSKSRFKFKYKFKLKTYKSFFKNKIKIILKFKNKFFKTPLKFFFTDYKIKNNFQKKLLVQQNKYFFFYKWKISNFTERGKIKKFKILKKNKNFLQIKNFKNSNILKITNLPFFFTKTKTSFLLKSYGFLFLNNNLYNYLNNYTFCYTLKKNLYSFSYKNEIQKFILKKYAKNSYLIDFIFKNNVFSSYSYSNNYLKFNSSQEYYNNFTKNDSNSSFDFFNFINNKENKIHFFLNRNISSFNNWTYYDKQINFFKNTYKDDYDFNIKRIKFKPGYMILWRDVRSVLKTSLSLNFRYQYKLTNYLAKYKKFINFRTFLFLEMRLLNILIKSRLFIDSNLADIFIRYNLIFLNGFLCNNKNLQIFVGDFIQVVINLKYYIISRWFLSLNLKKKNKIKDIFKKKNSSYSYSDEKKKSYNMPNWILNNKNLFDDCSNYLEVDYFTLSSFILYEPFLWSDINPYNLLEQKFSIINLYNWKYIT